MDLLTQLPLEIVNHILSFVAPEDLARVNTVCWYLYRAVKDNSALFRSVYLNHLVGAEALELRYKGPRQVTQLTELGYRIRLPQETPTGFRKYEI